MKRVPGIHEVSSWVQSIQESHLYKDGILIIPARMLATDIRREIVLKSINLDSIHILCLSTPIGVSISVKDMKHLMDRICSSGVWGVNFGEFQASDTAWKLFARRLCESKVGFAWINERGKDIGSSSETHDWLLGIGKYRERGILRGVKSPLALNRLRHAHKPWFDGNNRVFRHPLSNKFLFNPRNSRYFQQRTASASRQCTVMI